MLQEGKIIHNYRIISKLGSGGMGDVWLAENTQFERLAAIKSLNPVLFRDARIRTRFKQEAIALSKLQHPNIVALLDYHEDESGAYLVMEYVDGMPLDDYIEHYSGAIPTEPLSNFLRQMLLGIEYAHSKGIIHRDIKPANFMVGKDGTIKVLDFGIAKILGGDDHKLTKTGTNMGTVLYMSPEQVKGDPIDLRTDIYALGVTLFQMASGKCPYNKENTEFVVYGQIVNQALPDVREFYPGASQHTNALIQIATAKQPALRFQTCGDFLKALENTYLGVPAILEDDAITNVETEKVLEPSLPQKTQRPKRKKTLLWILAMLPLIAGAFFTAKYFIDLQSGSTSDVSAPSPSKPAQREKTSSSKQASQKRQRMEEEAERKLNAEKAALELEKRNIRNSISDYIKFGHSAYSIGLLGGISGLTIVTQNNTDYFFEEIEATVRYIKTDGEVYEAKAITLRNINPGGSAEFEMPNSIRGTSIEIELSGASSASLELCYSTLMDNGSDDPFHCLQDVKSNFSQ
jgi:serine/threonine protein kinase